MVRVIVMSKEEMIEVAITESGRWQLVCRSAAAVKEERDRSGLDDKTWCTAMVLWHTSSRAENGERKSFARWFAVDAGYVHDRTIISWPDDGRYSLVERVQEVHRLVHEVRSLLFVSLAFGLLVNRSNPIRPENKSRKLAGAGTMGDDEEKLSNASPKSSDG